MATFLMSYSTFFVVLMIAMTHVVCRAKNPAHVKDPISQQEHYSADGEHNVKYDHDAFLNKEDAKEFSELSPQESREQLKKLVSKMDTDGDGLISREELKNWIMRVAEHSNLREADTQMREALGLADEQKLPESISWDVYKEYLKSQHTEELEDEMVEEDEDEEKSRFLKAAKVDVSQAKKVEIANKVIEMLNQDKRKWDAADLNGDGVLSREEFLHLVQPESYEHMRPILVENVLEEIDTNKDGKIDLQEFVNDLTQGQKDEENSEWIKKEKRQFQNIFDVNKDGVLDKEEIGLWLFQPITSSYEKEVKHLIGQADTDKDGHLSVDEIVEKHDIFIGSQATNYGDVLTRHEEL